MKTWSLVIILVVIFAIIGGSYYYWSRAKTSSQTSTTEVCAKTNTSFKMDFSEAKNIASASQCVKEGALKDYHWCNEGTGTWWIDLNITRQGCSPACVIDVETKKAEINWLCTGISQ